MTSDTGIVERVRRSLMVVDWVKIAATLMVVLLTAAAIYAFGYVPFRDNLALTPREQLMWSVFSLLFTVVITWAFAKVAARREILRETQATARGAMRRILEAKEAVRDTLWIIDDRIVRLETQQQDGGSAGVNTAVMQEQFVDIRHQLSMLSTIMRYAESDWKEILPQDFAEQMQREDELQEARRKEAELSDRLARVTSESESEKSKTEADRKQLRAQVAELEQQIALERRRAATALKEAPFPMGTAGRDADTVQERGLNLAAVRRRFMAAKDLIKRRLAAEPTASDADLIAEVQRAEISLPDSVMKMILESPEIAELRGHH